jgi:hypothetical protein
MNDDNNQPANASDPGQGGSDIPTAPDGLEHRQGEDRRKSAIDRRAGLDRRQKSVTESGYTGPERRVATDRRALAEDGDTGLERRRGPGRRRSDDRRCAEEGEMTMEQFEFVMAIETYKKVNKRMYPTLTEILEVMFQLGYRKVRAREITLENVPEPDLYDRRAA